jgi:hypothetical protein
LPAVPAARPVVIVAPLVADTTEELVDLGLDGDLHHQAHAEPGDVLEDRGQLAIRTEQLIDVGTQARRGDTRLTRV